MKKILVGSAAVLTLFLSACGGNSNGTTEETTATVSGARSAVNLTFTLGSIGKTVITRPSSLLAVYVNILLADGLSVPVTAARQGIAVQLVLNAPASEQNLDNSYELLEEFAAILHVDIADMLNRSSERAKTLDQYYTGLQNITERSRRREEDLTTQIKELKTEERDRRKEQTQIEREIRDAVKLKDFSTAGAKQKELIEAQERVTRTSLQLQEVSSLQENFAELLAVADERIAAIEGNREILIAGLRAVDVPGVEDLNVIEGSSRRRKTRGSGVFGTF